MIKKQLIIAASFIFLLVAGNIGTSYASTLSLPGPTGITISPATQNINIVNSESSQVVNFSLTNDEPFNQIVTLKASNFSTINYSGGLIFVGTTVKQQQQQIALTNWLSLPESIITLLPKQQVNIPLTIHNISSLSPGGHYAALLIYINSSKNPFKSTGVSLQPVATSLMFITKLDGATYKLALSNVNAPHNFYHLPTSAILTFYNNGNTQVTPRGYITITDPENHLVSKGIINLQSGLVLPGTYRNFQVQLNPVSISKEVGNYKFSIYYGFDGYNQLREYQSKIFIGAPKLIILAILAFVVLIGVIYGIYRLYYRLFKKSQPKTHRKGFKIKKKIE